MDDFPQIFLFFYSISVFISVRAMQIGHTLSVEEILKNSKEVMTTMGEWELVGLTVRKFQQPAGNEEFYEELRFFVRKHLKLQPFKVTYCAQALFMYTTGKMAFAFAILQAF